MTAAPRRRWFRFDLRTMFVAVAIAAAISLGLAWRLQEPGVVVEGTLSQSDFSAVRDLVTNSTRFEEDEKLVRIRVISANELVVDAEVHYPNPSGGECGSSTRATVKNNWSRSIWRWFMGST